LRASASKASSQCQAEGGFDESAFDHMSLCKTNEKG